MALFDGHLKCAQCRDKGVGDEPCVLKKDCPICRALNPEQIEQLATPTYRTRKEKEQKKKVSACPVSLTPTLVDPSQVHVLGQVEGEKAGKSTETTPAGKKKRPDKSPKPSNKKCSSKPMSSDLKSLDEKWFQRFARIKAMLLAKSFAVPVELVKKPAAVVTSAQPFFDSGAGSSTMLVTQPAEVFTGASLVLATGDVIATQPGEAPGTTRERAATMTATRPVEAPVQEQLPPSLLRLPLRGWPPSLLRLPVTDRKCTLCPSVLVMEMVLLWTSPSPVVEL